MRITTTARHCQLDPEERMLAEQQLEKLSRFARDIHEVHLTISLENYRHTAEIAAKLTGREFTARETATTPRLAISAAIQRIEQQARRLKERRTERRRGDRARTADGSLSSAEPPEDEEGAAWEE